MAGSYKHVVTKSGKLRTPEKIAAMLETKGDVYEAVEEMYGMIWELADSLHYYEQDRTMADIVEHARKNYERGIEDFSPGKQKEH